jgi:exodeoxyribonuclease VII large subunit
LEKSGKALYTGDPHFPPVKTAMPTDSFSADSSDMLAVNPLIRTVSGKFDSALTISELNRQVKRMLEVSYAHVWVKGEMTGLSRPSSGHWYFTLKDDKAQIRCAMFKGFNQKLRFQPKEGDLILAQAKVSLYEGRGDYQLLVETMEPAGLGQLQAAFEALKRKLAQEGLFNPALKKPLPVMPKKVAVITSATGAVIHDIISVSKRRFPLMDIILLPVSVQGDNAAREIASAIEFANEHKLADVLIVGRGGGSLEDLWSFNEEVVARAIFNSKLPIISAVGHEVDFTIADLVADYRAPTPSAAAEKITCDQYELMQQLDLTERRLTLLILQRIRLSDEKLDYARKRLKHPAQTLEDQKKILSECQKRINHTMQIALRMATQQLTSQHKALRQLNPQTMISRHEERLARSLKQLLNLQQQQIRQFEHRLGLSAQTLQAASPLATLARGYAIIKSGSDSHASTSRVIASTSRVKAGDKITATLKDGILHCTVDSSIPKLDL